MTERAPLQEAMEALRPFAETANQYAAQWESERQNRRDEGLRPTPPYRDSVAMRVRLGDLRRAAAAFDSLSTHLKGEGDGCEH